MKAFGVNRVLLISSIHANRCPWFSLARVAVTTMWVRDVIGCWFLFTEYLRWGQTFPTT
jgi:hypothetical protein